MEYLKLPQFSDGEVKDLLSMLESRKDPVDWLSGFLEGDKLHLDSETAHLKSVTQGTEKRKLMVIESKTINENIH